MRFLIISHALHTASDHKLYAYAPYVREMNLWLKYVDNVEIVAPVSRLLPTKIDLAYQHKSIKLTGIPEIAFTSAKRIIISLLVLPIIFFKLINACYKADHIHLRCPGNIGLLGCLVQFLFPLKIKTAKYAGNWDPKALQPKSYRFQKWILSNTKLTRNIKVLVYGNWKNQSKNIKSFFTATYKDLDKIPFTSKDYSKQLNFVFVGSLVEGKRPLFAIKLIGLLQKSNINCTLNLFGDGILKPKLEKYIKHNNLKGITIHGNQTKDTVQDYLKRSHFTILASKSEGWPKALAEAMFFGVIPIATKISCVPYMLDYGNRGFLIEPDLDQASKLLINEIKNKKRLTEKAELALNWSQKYTLDVFEEHIKALVIK
ncbi:glycosyltransferase family 4 protein [Aurantibacter sp.]|uniref:glycosyltransferase family 4 protein n=1 Tax=Aurantibacter sp. TaxID=2807103 RepID=UPI0035C830F6